MSKLILLTGLQASGKSTFAKQFCLENKNYIRVNRDSIRLMLREGYQCCIGKFEDVVTDTCRACAKSALLNGLNVVIDDTNLNPKTINSWKDLIYELNLIDKDNVDKSLNFNKYKLEINNKFLDVSVDECILRVQGRVGETIIRSTAFRYSIDQKLNKNLILCDLDGNICNINERKLKSTKEDGKINYGIFFDPKLILEDKPRLDIMEQVKLKAQENNASILIVSGRAQGDKNNKFKSYEATKIWLKKYNFDYPILMRNADDYKPDEILKKEFLDLILKNHEIKFAYDDRPKVIRMLRENNINVIDTGEGIDF